MSEKANGTVKWYDDVKGYGFIEQPGAKDIFVHRNSIRSQNSILMEGQKVEFDVVQGQKGLQADNVVPL